MKCRDPPAHEGAQASTRPVVANDFYVRCRPGRIDPSVFIYRRAESRWCRRGRHGQRRDKQQRCAVDEEGSPRQLPSPAAACPARSHRVTTCQRAAQSVSDIA